MEYDIFVFGSNEAGRHGAGAALYAKDSKGAEEGTGIGRTGACYAIPTKDRRIRPLPLEKVYEYILDFLEYAETHPELTFQVTAVGTGLAPFSHEEMAVAFLDAPDNCYFDTRWKQYLGEEKKYWGTYE
jgi:hypothetical protein